MKATKLDLSLKQCYKCKGYFNEVRIDAHCRTCAGFSSEDKNKNTSISSSFAFDSLDSKASTGTYSKKIEKVPKYDGKLSPIRRPSPFNRPIALFCYLCGKEFGTSSLEIHLISCKKKCTAASKGVDPDSLRPEILDDVIESINFKKGIDVNLVSQYNEEAERIYKEANYFACKNCGRKFPEDRLEVHLRGCKPKSGWQNSKQIGIPSQKGLHIRTPSQNNLNKSTSQISTTPKILDLKTPKIIKQDANSSSGAGSIGFGHKPNFLICFVCGREFGKYSLEIHLKSCIEKKYETDEKSSKSNQIKTNIKYPQELESIFSKLSLNEDVGVNEILNYNDTANQIFRENTMKACPNCNRRFLPDRLDVHLRSCKASIQNNINAKRSASPGPCSRPKMLNCPLCGREFGTLSLPIHMRACKEKHELEQQKLPKNQRRSAEAIISKYNQMNSIMKNDGNYDIQNLNNDVLKMWNDDVLIPCDNCGRTFLPDRLQIHLRSCKKK